MPALSLVYQFITTLSIKLYQWSLWEWVRFGDGFGVVFVKLLAFWGWGNLGFCAEKGGMAL
jgi:hypothetical protein